MHGPKRNVIRVVVWGLVLVVIAAPSVALLSGFAAKSFGMTIPGQVIFAISLCYVVVQWQKLMEAPELRARGQDQEPAVGCLLAMLAIPFGIAGTCFWWMVRDTYFQDPKYAMGETWFGILLFMGTLFAVLPSITGIGSTIDYIDRWTG